MTLEIPMTPAKNEIIITETREAATRREIMVSLRDIDDIMLTIINENRLIMRRHLFSINQHNLPLASSLPNLSTL